MSKQHYARHYYLADNLDDLEELEKQLEAHHVSYEHIHVISNKDALVSQHEYIHEVPFYCLNLSQKQVSH